MTTPVYHSITRQLVCHPQTPSAGVAAIEVKVANTHDDRLCLSYVLQGDLDRIIIPPQISGHRPHRHTDNLWQHTCFEAFLMPGGGPAYREYNFSPSGEWASYMFREYRRADDGQSGQQEDESAPVIRVHRTEHGLTLEAETGLQRPAPDHALRLGLSAVIETVDGNLSCWALRHAPGKPDFHHAEAFALQLDRPDTGPDTGPAD